MILEVLGQIGDPLSVNTLLDRLATEPPRPEQLALLQALGKARDRRAYPLLKATLQTAGTDITLQAAALQALAAPADGPGRELVLDLAIDPHRKQSQRWAALQALTATGDPNLRPFFENLIESNPPPRVADLANRFLKSTR